MPALDLQRYRGREDLPRLLAFCSAVTAARAPSRPTWHPGDLVWQLRGRFDRPHALYAVVAGGKVIGAMWLQGEALLFDLLPSAGAHLPELLDASVAKARRVGSARLTHESFDEGPEARAALAAAGFARTGPAGVLFERDLVQAPVAPPATTGLRLRDCVGVDPEARALAHRAAWSALEHLGISGPSSFTAADYLSLATGGAYDPRFDIVAEAPDGRLVASATAWADLASAVAVFEPVGTAPEFRGRGLTAAAMTEAMARLAAAGVRRARVGTAHFNAAAIAAYDKAFERVGATSTWALAL